MSTLYSAKFNINENIYKVANGEISLGEILDKIYSNLNQEKRIIDKKDESIQYKFVNLHRNDNKMIINGRIVKIYDGINSTYDEKNDEIIDEETQNKADYVSFSFDVRKEIVGFVPKRSFSKENFIQYFEELVQVCVPEVGAVVLMLIVDATELEMKFKRMKTLKELEVLIIPENDDSKDIADLLDLVKDDLKETNAQHMGLKLQGTMREPLKKSSKLVNQLKSTVKKAYASLKAIGKDENNDLYTIDSEKDILMKQEIRSNNRDSLPLIEELTQKNASLYMSQKANEVTNDE